MRIVGKLGKRSTQRCDGSHDRFAIRSDPSRQRQRMACVALVTDQLYAKRLLDHRPGLADAAAIHPDEIGLLG
jgi:hypothetical protein